LKTQPEISPHGRYRRTLQGADFSLEANTRAVPQPRRFYLLKDGEVVFDSRDFGEAVGAYKDMCREYWKDHLKSGDPEQRISSAWGLLGLDPEDQDAAAVVKEDGDAAARKRLEQMRRRYQAERRSSRRKGGL
jgi:hypothetical protein